MFIAQFIRTGLVMLVVILQPVLLYAEPVSGEYADGLMLAFDKQHKRLTAYFENYTGWDERFKWPRFSCIFYIEAKEAASSPAVIKTWYPQDKTVIAGNLSWSDDDSASIFIKLASEHGGCFNVQPFSREKVLFELMEPTDWLAIEIVKPKKAYFHRQPIAKSKTRAYVIARDVVKVIKTKPDWVYAEYRHYETGRITRGWLKKQTLLNSH